MPVGRNVGCNTIRDFAARFHDKIASFCRRNVNPTTSETIHSMSSRPIRRDSSETAQLSPNSTSHIHRRIHASDPAVMMLKSTDVHDAIQER